MTWLDLRGEIDEMFAGAMGIDEPAMAMALDHRRERYAATDRERRTSLRQVGRCACAARAPLKVLEDGSVATACAGCLDKGRARKRRWSDARRGPPKGRRPCGCASRGIHLAECSARRSG